MQHCFLCTIELPLYASNKVTLAAVFYDPPFAFFLLRPWGHRKGAAKAFFRPKIEPKSTQEQSHNSIDRICGTVTVTHPAQPSSSVLRFPPLGANNSRPPSIRMGIAKKIKLVAQPLEASYCSLDLAKLSIAS